ncbi:ABC transporter ATP-binding protein [Mitsuokella sp. AF21-1AC]|uniref:ABC transporter ATP-binding protein n=1 Tax=Mitsuokella sp. AF21-1AC TaxID=2292235 RepID=UPI000E4D3952|nr:ABC transporter ATP-binding protein [Mitsuokella sp. AF21-1AC]RGS74755.1 ABC transporter ATP-binding protein [Mitsuokella sp. AF21-1AC]
MSVSIDIDHVVKRYGDNTVVKGLSAKILPGEFFTLLGPSGCGKTTLLRMIIGFNSIEEGEIRLNGKRINEVPTDHRNMGMVFQNYAIFPHMSVKDNVAFGLRMRKVPEKEIWPKVEKILQVVKIDHLQNRMPTELSGGQQQRVALARAIVIQPEVLLMDEPLSNLDAKLRVEMRNAIKNIQRQIHITTVYVTHDQEEALAVSDRIAVMNNGVIQQIGTPQHIYKRPANVFVAGFIGLSNFLQAKLARGEKSFDLIFQDGWRLPIHTVRKDSSEEDVIVSVRPEEFDIMPSEQPGIPAIVVSSVFLGIATHYFMKTDKGHDLEVIQYQGEGRHLPDGTAVTLQMKADRINVFHAQSQESMIEGEDDGKKE